MQIVQLHLLLPLLSIFTTYVITSALPQKAHSTLPTIKQRTSSTSLLDHPQSPDLQQLKRGFRLTPLVPGNPNARISNLPDGWAGIFSDVTALQPSIVVAEIFIQFFKRAARNIADGHDFQERWIQRIDGGNLILEIWNEDPKQVVTRELVEAIVLWLLHAANNGWTGFFVARVLDRVTRERIRVRLVNPNMLPG